MAIERLQKEDPLSTPQLAVPLDVPEIMTGVRSAATALNLHKCRLGINLLDVHSLRATGGMALKLQGEHITTIMKRGRWTSLTSLQYIHNEIAHLSKILSIKKSKKRHFQNIAAIEQTE